MLICLITAAFAAPPQDDGVDDPDPIHGEQSEPQGSEYSGGQISEPQCPEDFSEDQTITKQIVCGLDQNGLIMIGTYVAVVRHHYTWFLGANLYAPDCHVSLQRSVVIGEWDDC